MSYKSAVLATGSVRRELTLSPVDISSLVQPVVSPTGERKTTFGEPTIHEFKASSAEGTDSSSWKKVEKRSGKKPSSSEGSGSSRHKTKNSSSSSSERRSASSGSDSGDVSQPKKRVDVNTPDLGKGDLSDLMEEIHPFVVFNSSLLGKSVLNERILEHQQQLADRLAKPVRYSPADAVNTPLPQTSVGYDIDAVTKFGDYLYAAMNIQVSAGSQVQVAGSSLLADAF